MAVAFDALSVSGLFTNSAAWTHTPVGTPSGVIVYIVRDSGSTDNITAVTYGGVAMNRQAFTIHSGTEGGIVYSYFLGSGIPSGAQSVHITYTSIASCQAYAITVTAASDTGGVTNQTDGFTGNSAVVDPSFTLPLSSRSSFCSLALFSGQNQPTGISPLTGWTAQDETDFGSQTAACYTYNTIGTADVTAGWTQTASDACYAALAIAEATPPTITTQAADTITATSANGNGTIVDIGTDPVTTRGFV